MFKSTVNSIRGRKRQKTESMNTFDILRRINIISYFIGFRVFEYPRGNFRTKLSFLYAIILYISYFVGWYYQKELLHTREAYNLEEAVYQIATVFNQLSTFVTVIVGCHQSESLRLAIRRIHEVDRTLQALGSPASFNIIYNKTTRVLIYFFSQWALYLGLHIYGHAIVFSNGRNSTIIILFVFVQLYGHVVSYILILEFYVIMSCICSELKRANDLLRDINVLPSSSIAMELLDYDDSKDSFSTNKSFFDISAKLFTVLPYSRQLRSHLQMTSIEIVRSRRLLQTIRQVHLELYKLSKRINTIYVMQTSMEMSLCILYTTYFVYCLYYTYMYSELDGTLIILIVIGTCSWCFNNMAKIFSVNYICEKSMQQAQRTSEIIYTFYGQSTDSKLQEEIEIFSMQMMHYRVMSSASGLYAFNFKNICASVGAIATYSVIMIQVTSSTVAEIT